MRVALGTVEVGDYVRLALNAHYGDPGMATRDRVRSFVRHNGELALDDVVMTYEEQQEREAENA